MLEGRHRTNQYKEQGYQKVKENQHWGVGPIKPFLSKSKKCFVFMAMVTLYQVD